MAIDDLVQLAAAPTFSPEYYYNLVSSNGLGLTVLRDEGVPKITDGRGGWEVVDRRRRKGLTKWNGRNPWRMDVPVLFEGWTDSPSSVDKDIGILNAMALGDNFVVPPTVTITGNLPIQGATWVIENIQWGDNQLWVADITGSYMRVRQDAVIQLLQFVEEDVVNITNTNPLPKTVTAGSAPGLAGLSGLCAADLNGYRIGKYSKPNLERRWKLHNCPGDPPTGLTTVKHLGTTLRKLAGQEYDNGNLWTIIADANPNLPRDPNYVIPQGSTVVIPPKGK